MCRPTSCLDKIAFIVLILGVLACALSFSAPFWIRLPDPYNVIRPWDKVTWRGLWGMCCPDDGKSIVNIACIWIWEDFYSHDNQLPSCSWTHNKIFKSTVTASDLPAWYTASQIIFCVALGFLFLSIILESINACCRCCSNPRCFPTAVGSFVFAGAILVGLSLGLYGGFSYKDGVLTPTKKGGKGGELEWAFYVGIAGFGTCLIAALLFFIDGCVQCKNYGRYKGPISTQ